MAFWTGFRFSVFFPTLFRALLTISLFYTFFIFIFFLPRFSPSHRRNDDRLSACVRTAQQIVTERFFFVFRPRLAECRTASVETPLQRLWVCLSHRILYCTRTRWPERSPGKQSANDWSVHCALQSYTTPLYFIPRYIVV